jgi:hypothetical protein
VLAGGSLAFGLLGLVAPGRLVRMMGSDEETARAIGPRDVGNALTFALAPTRAAATQRMLCDLGDAAVFGPCKPGVAAGALSFAVLAGRFEKEHCGYRTFEVSESEVKRVGRGRQRPLGSPGMGRRRAGRRVARGGPSTPPRQRRQRGPRGAGAGRLPREPRNRRLARQPIVVGSAMPAKDTS